ncbi:polyketide synthase [Talaromyces proteolyticus]|uniref:Polyketide synthase n=1 Tax=Talaromyces proteolyticus TaxID=1131652 RepID=A0AAD4KKV6_9EURO|nr:polyketide synthase [Talaromyces proteolyticus]KAH8690541.1 polyketide synthase [Talaromyces proteolyticus]
MDKLEPIAIVGFSFQFPDAEDSESLWKIMVEKRCTVIETPKDRINVDAWYHPDSSRRGQYYTRGAHFLREDISLFDAPFFSLSSDEAAGMDPQQRLLLEVTYRALENAGIPIEKAAGTQTSVHVGCFGNDYRHLMCKDVELTANYDVFGANVSMNANRLSWFFDFRGTSMNIDTACSSSLVALDLACADLRAGSTDMGIVAGANLIISPDIMLLMSNVNMLSPDGRSYSFDQRANGYGRGEGIGTLIIKRLSDAIRDGDTIRAVIRSTASNQDGNTPSGIMQPKGDSQAALIRDTYEKAGLSMAPTRFFEAHGTGTPVGDPIELNAVGSAFRHVRTAEDPLVIGAIKSNIGHLEGASGIAGVIKTILILESGLIPPNTNFEKLNQKIDLEFLHMKLPLELTPWPTQGLRRASVNSFGFGGTNSHVILDDAFHFLNDHGIIGNSVTVEHPPSLLTQTNGTHSEKPFQQIHAELPVSEMDAKLKVPKLLVVSARDKAGIERVTDAYAAYFKGPNISRRPFNTFATNLAYTLNVRRSALHFKSFWLASSIADLQAVKEQKSAVYQALLKPSLAFVFTGQGAQWLGMGRELASFFVFKQSIMRCEEYLLEFGCPWSLRESIWNESASTNINSPDVAQPTSTALQIALVDLLESIGVRPAAVIGHSSGEIGAAYAYGALSAAEAMKIAYFRGVAAAHLTKTQKQRGAMIAVGLSEQEARQYIDEVASLQGSYGLQVACINSQKSTTVSGDETQVDALKGLLDSREIFARKLQVPLAYHSSHMLDIASEYRDMIKDLTPVDKESCRGQMISSVTGEKVFVNTLRSPNYWVQNLISPVQFAKSFNQICTDPRSALTKKLDSSHRYRLGINILLEIGPHAALQGPIRDLLEDLSWGHDVKYHAALYRGKKQAESFLNALGHLYCLGCPVDLERINELSGPLETKPRVIVDLPHYPFNHSSSYWRESQISRNFRLAQQGKIDLLGKLTTDSNAFDSRWRNYLRTSELDWVEDHTINGTVIYPAAGMLVMAIEAANQTASHHRPVVGFELKDVEFSRALSVPNTAEGVETYFHLRKPSDSSDTTATWSQFRLCFYENDSWQESCHGFVRIEYETKKNEVDNGRHDLVECLQWNNMIAEACNKEFEPSQLYKTLRESGFQFGPTFQTLYHGKYGNEHQAWALVKIFQWLDDRYPQPHIVHPTTLDGILHVILSATSKGGLELGPTMIPTGIKNIWVAKDGLSSAGNTVVRTSTKANFVHDRGHNFNICALDESRTNVLVKVDGLQSTIVADNTKVEDASNMKHTCYRLIHQPDLDMLDFPQSRSYCARARSDLAQTEYFKELNFTLFKFIDQHLDAVGDVLPKDIPAHIRKYIEWAKLQRHLFTQGKLPFSQPEWSQLLQNEAFVKAARLRIASANAQGHLFIQIGENLPSLLSGEIDPIQFLFKDDMIKKFYDEINNRPCFDEWDLFLRTYAHKKPDMKILEIGAGTGGTSSLILHSLSLGSGSTEEKPFYMSYDYTDVSPAFFDKARERFGKFPRMNFEVLDIEKDPATQGFEPHSYDLVIAANVLHATCNIRETFHNVRKLLKPGGKLMMYEITQPDILRTGFAFGLLSGWWAGEQDGRPWSPGLTSAQWDLVLKETNFSGIDLDFPDYIEPECQEGGILIATASEPKPVIDSNDAEIIYFVVDPASNAQVSVYEKAKSALTSRYTAKSVIIEAHSLDECLTLPAFNLATLVFIQETDKFLLSNMSSETFYNIQKAVHMCNKILFVTAGGGLSPKRPEYSLVDGWARTLRTEKASRSVVTLALDIDNEIRIHQVSFIVQILTDVVIPSSSDDYEPEFVEIDGLLHIPRVRPDTRLSDEIHQESLELQSSRMAIQNTGPLKLAIGTPGLLDTLHWRQDHECLQPLQPNEVEIDVKAVGINYKDCLTALGRTTEKIFGHECAGIVTRAGELSELQSGDRVAVFGPSMFKTVVRCKAEFTCKIPDSISFVEGSSIPTQFSTAWQAIVELGRLRRGESILIHAAAGGTGQACIQISQHIGADIYATVGSKVKKQTLMEEYQIPEDHIFYSRDTSFAKGVMLKTKGRGVDVVINSLAGEILRASWQCIASYGRFVDIGNKDILSNSSLPMTQFGRNASFVQFDGLIWMNENPGAAKSTLSSILQLFEERKLHVQTPLQALSVSEVEEAFRNIQSGTSAGKIVLEITQDAQVPTILPKPSFRLDPQSTYLIAGGLGGLGRTTARWMAARGAKNLVLLGRSGPTTEAALSLINELKAQGVNCYTPPCDVIDQQSVERVIQEVSQNMPPIKGCIQGSMVLRDHMFNDMSYEDWRAAVECKGMGSWNLEASLPPNLDFFVLLSSASGVVGLPGQANYASGNSYMDGFARYRVANSQKAISLDMGAMVDDGLLAETEGFLDRVLSYGALSPVTRQQFLGILDYYCRPGTPLLTPETAQVVIGLDDGSSGGQLARVVQNTRMFRHLSVNNIHNISGKERDVQIDFRKQFAAAASLQEGQQIISQALVHKFKNGYKTIQDDSEVNMQAPLHSLGVDSLLAVEVCNWIKKEFSADLAVFELMGGATLSTVGVLVANRSGLKNAAWK